MSSSNLVTLNNVSITFADKNILDNISFSIAPHRIYTLIGPNGAGKTTLVKCILGLIKATKGSVSRSPNLKIGYVPQRLKLNASLPLDVYRFLTLNKKIQRKNVDEALSMLNASHLVDANMHSLSGGEMQRVLLANAVLKVPSLLVLDEPVQGVDVNGQLALYALIADLKNQLNCSVFMVSHDLHLVMAKTDEVICLHHHICCQGEPELISSHPEYVSRFGDKASEILALYHHKHNHKHNLAGDPIKNGKDL